jgi:hypothetical protein
MMVARSASSPADTTWAGGSPPPTRRRGAAPRSHMEVGATHAGCTLSGSGAAQRSRTSNCSTPQTARRLRLCRAGGQGAAIRSRPSGDGSAVIPKGWRPASAFSTPRLATLQVVDVAALDEDESAYVRAAGAAITLRGYRSDWGRVADLGGRQRPRRHAGRPGGHPGT